MSSKFTLKRIGLATTTSPTGRGILIPGTGTGGGGEFGSQILDADRTFAITREPVAYRVVVAISKAIFDNWFILEGSNYRIPTPKEEAPAKPGQASDAKEEERTNQAFNNRVQRLLDAVNAKEELTRMAIYERGYGWAILVLGHVDDATSLAEPVEGSTQIAEIKAYGPPQITKVDTVTLRDDPRFGLPLYYYISRTGELSTPLKVHFSRCIHFATRLVDHDWKGKSVLDPIWDDLVTLRNIRWGMGQTMYRYGHGFPDLTFTGAEKTDIDDWVQDGNFSNLSARTYFAHNENQSIEFKGLAGRALDPMNYYLPPMEHISCGTGVPLSILRGAQAGALTGSEVNQSEYYGVISNEQSAYENGIRQLIYALVGKESDFTFNWLGGFELDEQKKQQIAYQRAQELDLLWNFYKRNEIRKMIDPDAADLSPEEGGDDLKTKSNGPEPEVKLNPVTGLPQQNPFEKKPFQKKEEIPPEKEGDKRYTVIEHGRHSANPQGN